MCLWYVSAASSLVSPSASPSVFGSPGPTRLCVMTGDGVSQEGHQGDCMLWRLLLISPSELSGQETSGFGSIVWGWLLSHSAAEHRSGRKAEDRISDGDHFTYAIMFLAFTEIQQYDMIIYPWHSEVHSWQHFKIYFSPGIKRNVSFWQADNKTTGLKSYVVRHAVFYRQKHCQSLKVKLGIWHWSLFGNYSFIIAWLMVSTKRSIKKAA